MVRLESHIMHNDLHEATQSAYKKHHSTETALLKISNDILCSLALSWFTPYLHNKQHRVCVNGQSSKSRRLDCGVPHGSVLGARMYTMYTRQIVHIIQRHVKHLKTYLF